MASNELTLFSTVKHREVYTHLYVYLFEEKSKLITYKSEINSIQLIALELYYSLEYK